MYYGTVHWPTVVCGEGVCESDGMITCQTGAALCALLTQDRELNDACGSGGRLEDAQSAIKRGADPNWKNVSLQLVHSQCCVSSVVSEHVVV